jgi:hypothetical protein
MGSPGRTVRKKYNLLFFIDRLYQIGYHSLKSLQEFDSEKGKSVNSLQGGLDKVEKV